MKPTHTPGPWRYLPLNGDPVIRGPKHSDNSSVLICVMGEHNESPEDARLIAAAPDMLSTLEAIQVRCACREFTTLDRDAQQLILYIIEQTSVAIRTAKEGAL